MNGTIVLVKAQVTKQNEGDFFLFFFLFIYENIYFDFNPFV